MQDIPHQRNALLFIPTRVYPEDIVSARSKNIKSERTPPKASSTWSKDIYHHPKLREQPLLWQDARPFRGDIIPISNTPLVHLMVLLPDLTRVWLGKSSAKQNIAQILTHEFRTWRPLVVLEFSMDLY